MRQQPIPRMRQHLVHRMRPSSLNSLQRLKSLRRFRQVESLRRWVESCLQRMESLRRRMVNFAAVDGELAAACEELTADEACYDEWGLPWEESLRRMVSFS